MVVFPMIVHLPVTVQLPMDVQLSMAICPMTIQLLVTIHLPMTVKLPIGLSTLVERTHLAPWPQEDNTNTSSILVSTPKNKANAKVWAAPNYASPILVLLALGTFDRGPTLGHHTHTGDAGTSTYGTRDSRVIHDYPRVSSPVPVGKGGHPQTLLSLIRSIPKGTEKGDEGVEHCISFNVTKNKAINWSSSKHLMSGSLVCISCEGFSSYVLGIIKQSGDRCLEKGQVVLQLVPSNEEELENLVLEVGFVYQYLIHLYSYEGFFMRTQVSWVPKLGMRSHTFREIHSGSAKTEEQIEEAENPRMIPPVREGGMMMSRLRDADQRPPLLSLLTSEAKEKKLVTKDWSEDLEELEELDLMWPPGKVGGEIRMAREDSAPKGVRGRIMAEGMMKLPVMSLAIIVVPPVHSVGPMIRGMGWKTGSVKRRATNCFPNGRGEVIIFGGKLQGREVGDGRE
eukprot:Gb_13750 [translate_table: standard]